MFLKLYTITLSILFVIDMIWLGLIAKNFYREQIGFLMKPNLSWPAVIIFYLLFAAALVIFVIAPALEKHQWHSALFLGALLGLTAYAAYDLTNFATIKNWPLAVTIVDMAWGMTLSAVVAVISYFVAAKFFE